jgi:DNA invertase Pin-like site-specific DNA recombinase
MKSILIARVSTEEQKDAGNSLPAQMARLTGYASARGFEVIKKCEYDESAYKEKRDEFDSIIEYIEAYIRKNDEVVAVCFDKVDRMTRNATDSRNGQLRRLAESKKIELHFANDNLIIYGQMNATQKAQFGMMIVFAEYYSSAVSDSVKRAQEKMLRDGRYPCKAPYGYVNTTYESGNKDIVPDPFQSEMVRSIYELYATDTYSMETIRKKISEKYSVKLSLGHVHKILGNEFYVGYFVYNGVRCSHRYEQILDRALWDRVQEIRKGTHKKYAKYAGKPAYYRTLIKCATCGYTMTPDKQKGHMYYFCGNKNHKGKKRYVPEHVITAQIAENLKGLQMPEDKRQKVLDALKVAHKARTHQSDTHFEELQRREASLRTQLDRLIEYGLDGSITKDEFTKLKDKKRFELNEVHIRLANINKVDVTYVDSIAAILELTSRASDLFIRSNMDERRRFLKLIYSNLALDGRVVRYNYLKPFEILAKYASHSSVLPLVNAFKNREIEFGFSLQNIQTVFETFNIRLLTPLANP